MIGTARLRRRLDLRRERLAAEPGEGAGRPSASLAEAAERLAAVAEQRVVEAEQARRSADRLLQSLDLVPQGLVFADETGAIAFRNRSAAAFLDARHGAALVGSAIHELVAEALAGPAVSRTVELFGPPRQALLIRAEPLSRGGGERGGEASAGGGGRRAGVFVVVEDVSERQRLEAVRRDFVANISHELKTPVGALSVLAETMGDETDPEVAARLAARMQSEALRMAQTIDDLLELSRIEADSAELSETVSVRALVDEAVDRTRHAAEVRGVELQVRVGPGDLKVVGDRLQLVSALSNLCDNAVKYSEPAQQVWVAATQVGDTVELSVADHGVGIPAADIERIFERFYRVDRGRSRNTGGTGLGLAIVRHVAHNHRGEVRVTSHEGEGSTFTLCLPAPADGLVDGLADGLADGLTHGLAGQNGAEP